MSRDHDAVDGEFAAAIAAAAFAINSLEESHTQTQYQREKKESLEPSDTNARHKKEDVSMGQRNAGKTSLRDLLRNDCTTPERVVPQHHSLTEKRATTGVREHNQEDGSARQKSSKVKADAWERSQMGMIRIWYDKTLSSIVLWESMKTLEARLRMERRKIELDQRMRTNSLHYQHKQARIIRAAAKARVQLEEKRKKERVG